MVGDKFATMQADMDERFEEVSQTFEVNQETESVSMNRSRMIEHTSQGNILIEQINGYTDQEKTKGLQLLDIENMVTANQATKKILNNGRDLQVSGKKVDDSKWGYVYYTFPAATIAGKTLHVYTEYANGLGCEFNIKDSEDKWTYPLVSSGTWVSITVPSNVVQCSILFYPNRTTSTEITGVYKNIKVGFSQFADWEPYSGGLAGPNPDHPFFVKGVGCHGFFDGLYRTIYFDPNGTQSTNPMWFLTDTIIPCKPGDTIKVLYEKCDDIDYYGIVYYVDGAWQSRPTNNKTGEWIVPSGVNGFRINCGSDTKRFDNNLDKLVILINGQYAICVKAFGENLCYFDQVLKTAKIQPDNDGIYYVPTANLPYHGVIWHNEQKITGSVYVRYTRKYEPAENGAGGCYPVVYYTDGTYENIGSSPVTTFQTVTITTNASKTVDYIYFSYGTYNSKTWIKELMVSRKQIDYTEPQRSISYIPLNYPLFEGDKIVHINGKYKIIRTKGFHMYDGSDDEDWKINYIEGSVEQNSVYNVYIGDMSNDAKKERYVPCNYFGNVAMGYHLNTSYVSLTGNYNIIISPSMGIGTSQQWKDWLKTHILLCVYELETSVEEPVSEDTAIALYSVLSCDQTTEFEIIDSNMELPNLIQIPKTQNGAWALTAYATSKRNEVYLQSLMNQNLDSRINKMEINAAVK